MSGEREGSQRSTARGTQNLGAQAPRRSRCERGSAAVLSVATVGIGVLLILGLGRIAGAMVMQARADAAADAAALAAADALALGRGAPAAAEAARATAADNGAVLVECECDGLSAEVIVSVTPPAGPLGAFGPARSRARAEIDPTALIGIGGRPGEVAEARAQRATRLRSGEQAQQEDRSLLVEVLVPVAALG